MAPRRHQKRAATAEDRVVRRYDDSSEDEIWEEERPQEKRKTRAMLEAEAKSSKKAAPKRPKLPRPQLAPAHTCLRDVKEALLRGRYRRVDAVFDDIARVYRDAARAADKPNDSALSAAKLCVQLCLEVMEDAASSVGAGEQWAPRTAEVARRQAENRPTLWQTHIRRTQTVKTNTGVLIREGVKLAIAAALRIPKAPTLQACVAAEMHVALALYVGNAAGPCKETAGRVLDIYGGWHLGTDVANAADAVRVTTDGGRIVAVVEDADADIIRERGLLVGRRFRRLGPELAIGTVKAYGARAEISPSRREPTSASTEYPRRGRGVAATRLRGRRLHGISTTWPRRRRDPPSWETPPRHIWATSRVAAGTTTLPKNSIARTATAATTNPSSSTTSGRACWPRCRRRRATRARPPRSERRRTTARTALRQWPARTAARTAPRRRPARMTLPRLRSGRS